MRDLGCYTRLRTHGRSALLAYTESSFVEQTTPAAFQVTDQQRSSTQKRLDAAITTRAIYESPTEDVANASSIIQPSVECILQSLPARVS